MIGKTFYIEGPATNAVHTADATAWSSRQYSECELAYIKFFDAGGNMVVPTAGVLKFQFSPEGEIWRKGKNATLAAPTVYAEDATMPYAAGMVHMARINMADLAGTAVTFKACFWRS